MCRKHWLPSLSHSTWTCIMRLSPYATRILRSGKARSPTKRRRAVRLQPALVEAESVERAVHHVSVIDAHYIGCICASKRISSAYMFEPSSHTSGHSIISLQQTSTECGSSQLARRVRSLVSYAFAVPASRSGRIATPPHVTLQTCSLSFSQAETIQREGGKGRGPGR